MTRTDKGGSPATLRVEAFAGPEPPATLSAATDTTRHCRSHVGPGKVDAVALHREDGRWVLGVSGFDLGQAFARAQGAPVAVKGGPIVAYAAGNFGGARLAGLDKDGRTVAWGGGYGYGDQVAACPGGTTVSVGRALEERGRLLTVDGTRVRHRDLPPLQAAAVTSDGFVAAVGADDASLVRIRPGGTRTLTRLTGTVYSIVGAIGSLAVAPDGRTAALTLHGRRSSETSIVTVDLRTGERLGSVAPRGQFVTGLAWVGPNRLLVRDTPFRSLPLRLLDRRAARWAAGRGRKSRTTRTAGSPRSAATRSCTAWGAGRPSSPAPGPRASPTPCASRRRPTSSRQGDPDVRLSGRYDDHLAGPRRLSGPRAPAGRRGIRGRPR